MADECLINEYSFSVDLPVDGGSPPTTYFRLIFNCNGETYVSPTFPNEDAAYDWVVTNWAELGTWSIDDLTLTISDTLCSVGELLAQSTTDPDEIFGCTDDTASNWNPAATENDGSCIYVSAIEGCTNQLATNYDYHANVDDGSCTFTPPVRITFDTASKKANQTKLGANIIQKYDKGRLSKFTAKAQQLNFQTYYVSFQSQSSADASEVKGFLDAVDADAAVYLSIKAPMSFNDFLVAEFADYITFLQGDQESELTKKGITDPQYIAWLATIVSRFSAYQISEDTAPIYRTGSAVAVARNLALAPLTYTDWGRAYWQLSPDRAVFSATDQEYNLALINNYVATLLPDDQTDFFALLTNLTKQTILQFHITDTGQQRPSDALYNYAIGEILSFALSRTEKYPYIFWMRLANLVRGNKVEFHTLKTLSPAFRFAYTMPVTITFSGVQVQGVSDGANSYGAIIRNQTADTQTLTKSQFAIPTKTVTSNFTRNTVWSAEIDGDFELDEDTVESTLTIRPYSVSFVTFTTS